MIVTNMKQAKFKCRECDCCSLNCGIKKKKKIGYKTTHTFTKRIEDKANDDNNNNNNNNNNNDDDDDDDGINNDNDNSTDDKIKTKNIKLKNK